MPFVWFILIGLAAGFLAGAVVKGHGFGLLGIATTNLIGALICAFVGAVVLLVLIGFIKRKGA